MDSVSNLSDDVRTALNVGAALQYKAKSYVWWTNDPWAALVAVAAVIFVIALVGIIILLNAYTRLVSICVV